MIFMGMNYPSRDGVTEAFPDADTGDDLRSMADDIQQENPVLAMIMRLAARDADAEFQSSPNSNIGESND
jgi:hypothetical protein